MTSSKRKCNSDVADNEEAHASLLQEDVARDNSTDGVLAIIPKTEQYDVMPTSQVKNLNELVAEAHRRQVVNIRRMEKIVDLKTRALASFKKKHYEKSITLFSKAISICKTNPSLYNSRAQCYINLRLYQLAVEDLKKALKLNPTSFEFGLHMAKAYFLRGSMMKYHRAIAKVKMHNPEQINFIQEYKGNLEMLVRVNKHSL